jgi:hypothetical protein
MKGGASLTKEERIQNALTGDYTPLINAIIENNLNTVNRLLINGADVNQPDNVYKWCPLKWAAFVFLYNHNHHIEYTKMLMALNNKFPRPCNDDDSPNLDMPRRYNFDPVIIPGDTNNYFNGDSYLHLRFIHRRRPTDNRTGGKMKRTAKRKNKRKNKTKSIRRIKFTKSV